MLLPVMLLLLTRFSLFYVKSSSENGSKGAQQAVTETSVKNNEETIEITGADFLNSGNAAPGKDAVSTVDGRNALIWSGNQPYYDWKFNVQQEQDYQIEVVYYPLQGDNMPIQRSIAIDGNKPLNGNGNVMLYRYWEEMGDGQIQLNNIGDEVRPRMKDVPRWMTYTLDDGLGIDTNPYRFHLNAGEHTLRMSMMQGPLGIEKIRLVPYEEIPSYQTVAERYSKNNYRYAESDLSFQAESTVIGRNNPSIRRENDKDPSTVPQSNKSRLLNVLGGEGWKKGGLEVTWSFNVDEAGLYKIGMRVGQWWNDGLPSYRRISVDGIVPFKELAAYKFAFDDNWRVETLGDPNGNAYYFYLDKGPHTLTMTAELGETSQIVSNINKVIDDISVLYSDIKLLTGSSPDVNYDYEFERNIPDLIQRMEAIKTNTDNTVEMLDRTSSKRTAMSNNLSRISSLFEGLIRNPSSIARKVGDINNMMISMGTWLTDLESQPLVIDYFLLGGQKAQWENPTAGFFKRAVAMLEEFWLSFFKDYDNVGYTEPGTKGHPSSKTLDVWVARGNEWAELLKETADGGFSANTGIGLKINVLTSDQLKTGGINSLMLAVAAGNAPDVCLGMDIDAPVEFAIRDAVVDLKQFPDFQDVSTRFYPALLEPVSYQNGVYALPETMNFMALFYRKDIVSRLNMEIPETWSDVYNDVLPVLNRNNMLFNYPSSTTLNQANFNSFGNFLFQNGGELYKDDGKASGLDSTEAFKAFEEWTQLYTNYDFPVAANFFNRFRNGEMPMGIGGYQDYILLSTAAPELRGKWDMAPVPGEMDGTGKVNRTVTGTAGTYDVILSQSQSPEDAWEFIKWWTSTETQKEYSSQIESLMGLEARWNSANIEAFKALPWDKNHLDILVKEFETAKEKPVVLGGYFTLRHITNAWTRVVIDGMDPRESLDMAVKDINKELRAKQEEFGIN